MTHNAQNELRFFEFISPIGFEHRQKFALLESIFALLSKPDTDTNI